MAVSDLRSRILALLEEDREFLLSVAGLVGLKEVLERLEEHDKKLDAFNRKMDAFGLKIEALGSRGGIFAEHAFREGMRSVIEQYFGGEVERWIHDDKGGIVFGHPSKVEVDLTVAPRRAIIRESKRSEAKTRHRLPFLLRRCERRG